MSSSDLVGTWKLLSMETRHSDGEVRYPLGMTPSGRIIYDAKGNMAVTVAGSDRAQMASPDKTRATAEEKAAALDSFEAYFGTFTIDEKRHAVIHHVEGALFPNWVGGRQERFYTVTGDRLELSTAPMAYTGHTVTIVLVWERM